MKNRIIITLLCLLCVNPIFAGKKQMLKEAIRRGPSSTGFYCIENTKGEHIFMDAMRLQIVDKNHSKSYDDPYYIALEGEIDNNRWVNKLYFIEEKDYPAYVFCCLGDKGRDLNLLKRMGRVSLILDRIFNIFSSQREIYLSDFQDALWTGSVTDGYIHGKGAGLIIADKYIYFEGEFDHGCQVSPIIVKYYERIEFYKMCSNGTIDPEKVQMHKFSVPTVKAFYDRFRDCKQQADKKSFENHLHKLYNSSAIKIEEARKEALTVNQSNYKSFEYPKTNPKELEYFTEYYQKLNYDPQNIIIKAQEVRDFYTILQGMKITVEDVKISFPYSLLYTNYSPSEKRGILKQRIELAKKWQAEGKCGLGKFYSSAINVMNETTHELNEIIDAGRKAQQEYEARIQRETEIANSTPWVEPDIERPWEQVMGIFSPEEGSYKRFLYWNSNHMGGEGKSITIYQEVESSYSLYRFLGSGKVAYKNYRDAVAAAYVYLKTGYVRTIGSM